MPDPTRLDDAFASLTLPADDVADAFLTEWQRCADDQGHPFPLPPGWRSEVGELAALGLDTQQAGVCVAKAMTAEARSDAKRFAYAMATARNAVRIAHQSRTQSIDPNAPKGDYVVSTTNWIIRVPTCRTLRMTSPLNIVSITTIGEYRPCRVCLS